MKSGRQELFSLVRPAGENTHMADSTNKLNSHGDNGSGGTPLWVKLLGIIAGILILLFVILHLAFGGMGGHTT